MKYHHNQCNKSLSRAVSLFFPLLIKAMSIFKVSFIIGSCFAFFSATSIVAPLAGAFTGISGTCVVFALCMLAKLVCGGTLFSLKFLAFIVPGFCASLYWSSSSAWIRVVLPLLCMMLFIIHPEIGAGWVYSIFWLVPVALYAFGKKNIFSQSLGSTFTAHAVGSVIWLYASSMTPQAWLALMPVVVVERLLFATGMVIAYQVMQSALHAVQSLSVISCKKHLA